MPATPDMTITWPASLLPAPHTDFGHRLRGLWSLDPAIHFLNHGSYGAVPRHVLAAQLRWREAMEREPVRFVAERHDLTVIEACVPWPLAGPGAIVDAYAQAIAGGARLAIIDHVFSPLAVLTPLAEVVPLCRERGVHVLVDGAHAPGMLALELDALGDMGVDWYVGNGHKWLFAPKGCGFIVATPEGQRNLHPVVISNYFGEGFEQEFAWSGTGDPSARLAVTAALEFIEALGVDRYRNALQLQACEAAQSVAAAWGVMPGAPPEMFAGMVTLPLPVYEPANAQTVARWRRKLLDEHRIEVPVIAIEGRLWVRISAQVYNELSDCEALARVFA